MGKRTARRQYVYSYPRPMVTVDLVVLTPMDDRLGVLLIRRGHEPFRDRWALPGGFVDIDEPVEAAACRELAEETGLHLPQPSPRSALRTSRVWMDQLRSFGLPGRDPRGRTITVAYLVLIRPGCVQTVRAGDDAADAKWHNAHRLPKLAFDHRDVVRCALARLRDNLDHEGLAFWFVPTVFSLDELQAAYELILRQPLDRQAFQRRVSKMSSVTPAGERGKDSRGRPVRLYRHRPARG